MTKSLYIAHSVSVSDRQLFIDDALQKSASSESETRDAFARALYKEHGMKYPKFYKMDEFCRLGIVGMEYLTSTIHDMTQGNRTGLFLVNSRSSIQTDVNFYNSYSNDEDSIASPSLFVYTLPNILLGEISIRYQITGEHSFFLKEDFELEFIYLYVKMLFQTGRIEGAVIGTCEVTPDAYRARLGWVCEESGVNRSICFDYEGFKEWIEDWPGV